MSFSDFTDITSAEAPKLSHLASRKYSSEVRYAFGWTDISNNSFNETTEINDIDEHQAKLPTLPVPDLSHTLSLYLESLKPLATPEEYKTSEEITKDFAKPGGDGERLQSRLVEIAKSGKSPSWLEPFWDDSYLLGRSPIPINVNYFFALKDHEDPKFNEQARRAASLLSGGLNFYTHMRKGNLEMDKERGSPLCMNQYQRVFGSCRVPGKKRDSLHVYSTWNLPKRSTNSETCIYHSVDPTHVVVLSGNHFYWFDAIENGEVIPYERIVATFTKILEESNKSDDMPPPIGIFTTARRDVWAEIRQELIDYDAINEKNLEIIQSSLIVVCLDRSEPADNSEHSRLLLHGPGSNRWFDKINLIVCANGKAGINFEHAIGDGATTIRVADAMVKWIVLHPQNEAPNTPVDVQELVWKTNERIIDNLRESYAVFKQQILGNETSSLDFTHFGGLFLKSADVSPDAFVQVALQLTYYKMFGKPAPTYESASTRAFLHGRTETVRSCTSASLEFCKLALQPLFGAGDSKSQYNALRKAIAAHVSYMREAKTAQGVDRHLFGLKALYEIEALAIQAKTGSKPEPPSIYRDPLYSRSAHWQMSTSHCGCSSLTRFGFGPVVADGFGIGYMIKNNVIAFNITSKYFNRYTSSSIFAALLSQSLLLMQAILLSNPVTMAAPSTSLTFTHPTVSAEFSYFQYDQEFVDSVFGY